MIMMGGRSCSPKRNALGHGNALPTSPILTPRSQHRNHALYYNRNGNSSHSRPPHLPHPRSRSLDTALDKASGDNVAESTTNTINSNGSVAGSLTDSTMAADSMASDTDASDSGIFNKYNHRRNNTRKNYAMKNVNKSGNTSSSNDSKKYRPGSRKNIVPKSESKVTKPSKENTANSDKNKVSDKPIGVKKEQVLHKDGGSTKVKRQNSSASEKTKISVKELIETEKSNQNKHVKEDLKKKTDIPPPKVDISHKSKNPYRDAFNKSNSQAGNSSANKIEKKSINPPDARSKVTKEMPMPATFNKKIPSKQGSKSPVLTPKISNSVMFSSLKSSPLLPRTERSSSVPNEVAAKELLYRYQKNTFPIVKNNGKLNIVNTQTRENRLKQLPYFNEVKPMRNNMKTPTKVEVIPFSSPYKERRSSLERESSYLKEGSHDDLVASCEEYLKDDEESTDSEYCQTAIHSRRSSLDSSDRPISYLRRRLSSIPLEDEYDTLSSDQDQDKSRKVSDSSHEMALFSAIAALSQVGDFSTSDSDNTSIASTKTLAKETSDKANQKLPDEMNVPSHPSLLNKCVSKVKTFIKK